MSNANFDLVIFDCDGTLVDSVAAIATVVNITLQEQGFPAGLSNLQVGTVVGLSLEVAVAAMLPNATSAEQARVVERYKHHYRRLADLGELPTPIFPGVVEVLHRLEQAGIILAVATGKSRRGVERTLREQGLERWFAVVKSADCAPSKPHPGMVEQILETTGVLPNRCLVVGDTEFDILMGHNAGTRTCAVTYGAHPRERLLAARPDHIIDDFSALLAVVGI